MQLAENSSNRLMENLVKSQLFAAVFCWTLDLRDKLVFVEGLHLWSGNSVKNEFVVP